MTTTILIVDDQPESAALLRLYFEKEGLRIIEIYNCMDALMTISNEKVDLMLVDLMMLIIMGISKGRRISSFYILGANICFPFFMFQETGVKLCLRS